jgi:hypothetical protein
MLSFANSLPNFTLDQLVLKGRFQHLAPTVRATKNNPRWPPREQRPRQPHPSTMQRRQHSWRRRKAKPSWTPPPRGRRKMTLSTARDSARITPPRRHCAHLQFRGRTPSTTTRLCSARGRRHHRGWTSHRHLGRRPAKATSFTHKKQSPAEAEGNHRSQAPTNHHASQSALDDTR